MPRVMTILVALVLDLLTLTSPASAQGDRDCYQFTSWYDAQEVYEASMYNPGWDVFYLDEDGDGLACECLYYGYHCLTPWD
jgi:Excalibur calcium-binding domain